MKTTFLCMMLMLATRWTIAATPEKEIRSDNVPNFTFDQMMGVVMQLRVGMTQTQAVDILEANGLCQPGPTLGTSLSVSSFYRLSENYKLELHCVPGFTEADFTGTNTVERRVEHIYIQDRMQHDAHYIEIIPRQAEPDPIPKPKK